MVMVFVERAWATTAGDPEKDDDEDEKALAEGAATAAARMMLFFMIDFMLLFVWYEWLGTERSISG